MTQAPPARDAEYDHFGPWVLEISEDEPPPRLFVPHLRRGSEPLISIKVPRKISRRDAHPGMDLYDYVVSLYETDMVVLQRVETDIRARTVAYRDIRHLQVQEELLRGTLHLGIPGDPCTLPYNTVSAEVMTRVAAVIRERYRPADTPVLPLPPSGELRELSFYFERLLKEERADASGATPLAMQPNAALGAMESSPLRKLVFGLVDKRLLESLHLCDGQELRVTDRGRPFAYRWQTSYGRRETIVPLANISGVTWDEATGDPATATLTVSTAGGDSTWAFTRDNPSVVAYREWLERLAATRRR